MLHDAAIAATLGTAAAVSSVATTTATAATEGTTTAKQTDTDRPEARMQAAAFTVNCAGTDIIHHCTLLALCLYSNCTCIYDMKRVPMSLRRD
jgi:hypothetical protein